MAREPESLTPLIQLLGTFPLHFQTDPSEIITAIFYQDSHMHLVLLLLSICYQLHPDNMRIQRCAFAGSSSILFFNS
jgi:hypothetical protein